MNALVVVTVIVALTLLVAVVAHRVTRPADHVPPRRRELNRERKIALSAQSALYEVRDVLSRYRPLVGVDDVGLALLAEVQEKIAEHDKRMMEVDR